MTKRFFSVACVFAISWGSCFGGLVEIPVSRDNSIFNHPTLDLSNGAGPNLFAGVTGVNNSFEVRRALLQFDLAGQVPAGSTVTSVTLRINVSKTPNGAPSHDFTFHRLTEDWGEGTSFAAGQGGSGAGATTGDATWDHQFFSSQAWTQPGGDFVAGASTTQSFGDPGIYLVAGAGLVTDVQTWLGSPADNYGWILMGDEADTRNARRFTSREGDPDFTPTLIVGYAAIPELSTVAGLWLGFAFLLACRRLSGISPVP